MEFLVIQDAWSQASWKREAKTTEGLANPSGLRHQSLMYCLTFKSVLNKVQPIKGFVYESVRYPRFA